MEVTIPYYGRWLNDDRSTTLSINRSSMLKVSQVNNFLYFEFDALETLDKLLKKGLI